MGWLAAFVAAVLFASLPLRHSAMAVDALPAPPEAWLLDVFPLLWASLALALFAYSHRSRRPDRVLVLGDAFQVLLCFDVGALEAVIVGSQGEVPRLSFAILPILAFTLLVGGSPRRRTFITLLSLVALPSGGAVAATVLTPGFAEPPSLLTHAPTWLASLFALPLAHTVHGYQREIRRMRELGAYELIAPLGKGGMGQVWRAHHRLLDRAAAVKLIRAQALGDDPSAARARFEREARLTAGLGSVHTVQVHDFGCTDDGCLYYAMELLDGVDLEALVRSTGPQPPARVAHILQQACRSLHEAHVKGLVHRDIKPANIMLCRQGLELDFVKVLDLGLVASIRGGAVATQEPCDGATSRVAGTPAFMAPEVALGLPVDGRTDLYSLGCVAYWLLTGRRVFEAASRVGLVASHVHESPSPVSEHAPGPVPVALERLVLKCLSKDPDRRPSSAAELERALSELATVEPWTQAEARRCWHRTPGEEAPFEAGPESSTWPAPPSPSPTRPPPRRAGARGSGSGRVSGDPDTAVRFSRHRPRGAERRSGSSPLGRDGLPEPFGERSGAHPVSLQGRRSHPRIHPPRSRQARRARGVPRGPVLSTERRAVARAAAARASGRRPGAGPSLPRARRRSFRDRRAPRSRGARRRASRPRLARQRA